MDELKRDFRLLEIEDDLEFTGVDQVISVQARRTDRENHFLIDQANKSDDLVAAVVGWAPLDSPDLRVFLDQYIREPLLKGVREEIAGTPDQQFLNNPDFDEGINELTHRDLAFDLFISQDQLPAAIDFVDRHPNQRMVLNHCGCPCISDNESHHSWARHIRELARRPHVFCKISGFETKATVGHRNTDLLRPYFDTVIKAFTPSRLMYGSNWPLSKLHTSYPAWLNTVDDLIFHLSEDEKNAVYQETAVDFYRL